MAILEALSGGEELRAYHIACYARLKWVELAKDLESLVALGLVEKKSTKSGVLYSITQSGKSTLEKYRSVEEVFKQSLKTDISQIKVK